ncbi:MAG TPA: hypothetical protein V6D29_21020 [Leptolyngbyaceae cyanobacterium]
MQVKQQNNVVEASKILHRLACIGTAIAPDGLRRRRGSDAAKRTEFARYDADARAVLN